MRPRGGGGDVVGAGKSGDGVQQDDDVTAGFNESLGAGQDELSNAGVLFNGLVKGGGHDLGAFNGALPVRDFFRSLSNEGGHDVG